MAQAAIVGLMLINIALGVSALWPRPVPPHHFRTLVVLATQAGQVGVFQWLDGAFTPEEAIRYVRGDWPGLVVRYTAVIDGDLVDQQWAASQAPH